MHKTKAPANPQNHAGPRLAVRAILVHDERLLLVNAYKDHRSDLWCAPGGGVERGGSLHDNLAREVFEECGIEINVGDLALVNEFHDPAGSFHQVEVFFHCTLKGQSAVEGWQDVAGVVNRRRWVSASEYARLRVKPDSLFARAFGAKTNAGYDPLEAIIR